jgi:hypothetical protein
MIFKGKQQTKLNLILFFILLLLPVTAFCNEARFVIFHTSDIHGHITSRPDPTSKEEPRPMIGGFAVLKNLINNYKMIFNIMIHVFYISTVLIIFRAHQ